MSKKIHAGGKVYNAEDFVCEWCKVPLVVDTYYSVDGKNVCNSCRNSEKCKSCGFIITETKYVVVDNNTYHPDCFRCVDCLVELENKFHVDNGDILCSDCLALRAPCEEEDMCPKCFLQLSGGIIRALGKRYHENCFVCHCCSGEFPNDEFVNIAGNPFCDPCIDSEAYLQCDAYKKSSAYKPPATTSSSASKNTSGSGSGPSGYGAGNSSGQGGYGAPGGSNGGAGGYGSGAPGSGSGGAGGAGSGNSSGQGGYGAPGGSNGSGAGGSGSGAPGSGAGGYGNSGNGGSGSAGQSGATVVQRSAPQGAPDEFAQTKNNPSEEFILGDDEYETVIQHKFLDPSGLPPKGASKYDIKPQKSKYGNAMKETKKTRDYKSKAALGFSHGADHLKDMDSLGYKTLRGKPKFN